MKEDYTCEDARRWLVMLTEPGEDLPAELHLHLTECVECRGLATDYQAALSAYRTVTNDDLSVPRFDDVREATRTKLKAIGPLSLVRHWWWLALPVVAVVVAALLWRG